MSQGMEITEEVSEELKELIEHLMHPEVLEIILNDTSIHNSEVSARLLITGTESVGKSTLVNSLFGNVDVSIVSPIPNDFTAKSVEIGWLAGLTLVDSPSFSDSRAQLIADLIASTFSN